ncbi:hypothetical protein KKF91_14170 [Myxococcota bacterium]|nr:hypothetical protein [Myxococcota bacterium]
MRTLLPWIFTISTSLVFGCIMGNEEDDKNSGEGSAGSVEGSAGSGGTPNLQLQPNEVTQAEDCAYLGGDGGSNGYGCENVTINFEPNVEIDGFDGTILTSLGDTFKISEASTENSLVIDSSQTVFFRAKISGNKLDKLIFETSENLNPYILEWIEVKLTQDGDVFLESKIDVEDYKCVDLTSDDWCWNSKSIEVSTDGW